MGNEAVAERERAYARLHSVLEATSDQVVTLSHDWTVAYANGSALQSVPELRVGANYWSCFPLLLGTPAEQYQREAMAGRSEVFYDSFYTPHEKWYRVKVYPVPEGVAIFLCDITEERSLREKRVEALSLMAGGLAHEISNPLAIIHGWANDLKIMASQDTLLSSSEVGTICGMILKTTSRATNILEGLRAFASESAHDPMEPASIYTILDQSLELQEARFERQRIELRTEFQADIPPFACREVQIGQILTNLLNNAFDAIVQSEAEERWVTIRAWSPGLELCVEVIDSGPGIDEQLKPHLMKPFFTTKELGLGMGVGLSLSRAIAHEHGGTLTLVTDSKHTCLRLSLPVGLPTLQRNGRSFYRKAPHEVEQG